VIPTPFFIFSQQSEAGLASVCYPPRRTTGTRTSTAELSTPQIVTAPAAAATIGLPSVTSPPQRHQHRRLLLPPGHGGIDRITSCVRGTCELRRSDEGVIALDGVIIYIATGDSAARDFHVHARLSPLARPRAEPTIRRSPCTHCATSTQTYKLACCNRKIIMWANYTFSVVHEYHKTTDFTLPRPVVL
jgi:hypothetical protein